MDDAHVAQEVIDQRLQSALDLCPAAAHSQAMQGPS